MSEFGSLDRAGKIDELLYKERTSFIMENYPKNKSRYGLRGLLNSGLDGMAVLEKRNEKKELEGIVTYDINRDHENILYCSIGIILTDKDSRGEGVMQKLFSEVKQIAIDRGCEYIVAIADTDDGEKFSAANGFYEEEDSVTGRTFLRLDL